MNVWMIFSAVGLPTAMVATMVGILFHRLEKRLDAEKKARRDFELFQIRTITATMGLCEANAIALQRGKCNGETHRALEYMQEVKREQRDFLISQGVEHIF